MDLGPFKAVPWVWLIVFIFLSLTDWVDGFLARKLNAKSVLGAHLDAISDVVLLVIAVTCVLAVFAVDSLTTFERWFYVGLLVFCSGTRMSMNLFAKKYHGVANMLHSYPQKTFAASCYVAAGYWALIRDLPWWSAAIIVALTLWGAIDEIIYCARAAKYDVNFKGHGFQKYETRKK